jgi:hypothetical protein
MFCCVITPFVLKQVLVRFSYDSPTIYVLFLLFALTVYPWTLVRKVAVINAEVTVNHGIFTFKKRLPAHGFVRISREGWEWHSFGLAYVDEEKGTFDLLITRAGDWTGRLLDDYLNNSPNKPTYFYVRRRGVGFSYTLYAYKRVLVVATGGGTFPLSFLFFSVSFIAIVFFLFFAHPLFKKKASHL